MTTFATVFLLCVAAGMGGPGPDPFRALDFDAAVKAAAFERKPVMVLFGSPASPDTKKLDSTTWSESKVRFWVGSRLVAIKVDADREQALVTRFRIHILPTLVFLNEQGVELDRITGYIEGRAIRAEAEAILAGGDPVERMRKRLVGHERDPHLRIDLGGALYDRGLLEQALAEYLWCWDHALETDPGFAAARRGFLLRAIQRLGRVYPAASDALAQRATQLYQLVSGCSADDESLADFLALERVLERDYRVLEAYDAITADTDECRRMKERLQPLVLDPLIDVRRYKDAVALMGDVDVHAGALITAGGSDLRRLEKERLALATEARLRKLRSDLSRVYESLLGAERYDDAAKLARRVLVVDAKGATYVALLRAALRAQAHGAARSIAVKAYGDPHLSEAEKLEVKSAAREILQPR